MIEIQVNNLVKSFEVGKNVLDGLTFQVDQGERVGLLGRNGAGKTTLFKILTGELDYDEGTVVVGQGRRVGLISQIPVYPAGCTVEDVLRSAFARLESLAEEMRALEARMAAGESDPAILKRYGTLSERFEAFGGYDTDVAVNKIANGLSIPDSQRSQLFDSLSGGEKTRVNLGRLILEDTDILLLDEPTNHLDLHATEWLEEYIRSFHGTVVTISHDRYFLDRVTNRTLEIATAQNPGVNFIISAGDQVNKTGQAKEEEYAGYLSPAVLAGLPVATTIGNHDKSSVDYTGDTYRDVLGPRWYSFNRGEVHFVAMDNCLFSGQDYTGGFTDEQVAWLEKDLSFVPTSKMIVLYYHIPLRDTNYRNRQKVLDLISKYQNPTLMCAHTHYFQPYHMRSHNLFERIHGGTCGYFWRSNCGGDGTPNGFMVYEIDGTKIVDTYFKASQRPDDHQIRLYHGDAVFAGPYATYKYDLGADVVVANVFAAGMDGTTWKVELSEDGGKTWSDMSPIEQNYGDRWIRGYHIGVEHHPTESGTSPCYHQYQYKLKDAAATAIEVRATDSFGHVYTQDTFTADNDFTEAEKY